MQPSLAILFLLLLPRGQIPLLRVLLTRVLPFTVRLSVRHAAAVGDCGGRDRGRGRRARKPTTDPAASIVLGDGSDGNGAKG